MPKKIVKVTWKCRICSKEHDTKPDAKYCESLKKPKKRYKKGDRLIRDNDGRQAEILIGKSFYRFLPGTSNRPDQHVLYYWISRGEDDRTYRAQSTLDRYVRDQGWMHLRRA